MNTLWGDATSYIIAVYGVTVVSFAVLIVLSVRELTHWKKRARDLDKPDA